jgi:hypothetical protein
MDGNNSSPAIVSVPRCADLCAAVALTGGPEDRDSAGEGTGGTFSEKFSPPLRTVGSISPERILTTDSTDDHGKKRHLSAFIREIRG